MQERTRLSDQVDRFHRLAHDLEEGEILLDLAVEESDAKTLEEAGKLLKSLDTRLHKFSLDLMLDGDDDRNNAIVSINAGAGGTEAQDWAEMLFRMYLRWVERKGYASEVIDYQPGDVHCRRQLCLRVSEE